MQLIDFECPNCGAADMITGDDEKLHCTFCGSAFGEVSRICPKCGHYNDDEVRHCSDCGTQIIRDCPACGWDNWVLADHCSQCGRNLDLIDRMARRWEQSSRAMLAERRGGIEALKLEEERASQERMAGMLEVERQRQEALARSRAARQERDRQMYQWIIVGAVIFVFVVVALALLLPGG